MNIEPIGQFILTKPIRWKSKKEKKTKTGIYLPDQAETRPDLVVAKGEVLAVGKEVKDVKKGEFVLYNYFSGNLFYSEEDEELHLVWEKDVLAKEER